MDPAEEYSFYERSLPDWGIDFILLATDSNGKDLYPVRTLCEAIGLHHGTQSGIVQEDSRIKGGSRWLKAPTRGGRQATLYLYRREVAIWFTCIDPGRVKGPAKGRLEDFQEDLWHLAEETVFLERRVALVRAVSAGVSSELHGVLRTKSLCPCCGAPLDAEVDGATLTLTPDEHNDDGA